MSLSTSDTAPDFNLKNANENLYGDMISLDKMMKEWPKGLVVAFECNLDVLEQLHVPLVDTCLVVKSLLTITLEKLVDVSDRLSNLLCTSLYTSPIQ